jgi:hypothetical protein
MFKNRVDWLRVCPQSVGDAIRKSGRMSSKIPCLAPGGGQNRTKVLMH